MLAQAARSFATACCKRVVIVSTARTPIGGFNGKLAGYTASQLGSIVIKEAIKRANLKPTDIPELIMGHVCAAGVGQAPARQAALGAGLPESTITWAVNKVCASGLKAVMLATSMIQTGEQDIVLAGGMESMTNVPYYVPGGRWGMRYGNGKILDGMLHDGLWDPYSDQHMGMCAEYCAETHGPFTRKMSDDFALESYRRALEATKAGWFKREIVPVKVKDKMMDTDEEPFNIKAEKVPTLKPAFKKNGTVTAANASKINDGAAALVVMSEEKAAAMGLKPLARILGFGDGETKPVDFTVAPSIAVKQALVRCGMALSDVEYHEINEAFSVVGLVNMKRLGLDHARVNVFGGAVALGHPLGMSGNRLVGTIINVLRQKDATIGCVSVCNGGGGASALILERLE